MTHSGPSDIEDLGNIARWERIWLNPANPTPGWKIGEPECAYWSVNYLAKHLKKSHPVVFVPLGGDCHFIRVAYDRGYTVIVNEFVAEPVDRLIRSFESTTTFSEFKVPCTIRDSSAHDAWRRDALTVFCSADHRLVIWRCSLYDIPLAQSFDAAAPPVGVPLCDAIYDKDSFGAIDPATRTDYVAKTLSFLAPGGTYLLEAKDKSVNQDDAPPPDALTAAATDPSTRLTFEPVVLTPPKDALHTPTDALFTSGPPFHITTPIVSHYFGSVAGVKMTLLDIVHNCYAQMRPYIQSAWLLRREGT